METVEKEPKVFNPTRDWFSRAIPLFDKLLWPLAGKPGLCFMEIGSFEGRSALWLLENVLTAPDATLFCVDTWKSENPFYSESYPGEIYDRFKKNILDDPDFGKKVHDCRGESILELSRLLYIGGAGHHDFIYVDGSHAAPDVLADAVLTWRLLKHGGIILFDDYRQSGHNGPFLALNGFMDAHRGEYDVLHNEYQLALRKNR